MLYEVITNLYQRQLFKAGMHGGRPQRDTGPQANTEHLFGLWMQQHRQVPQGQLALPVIQHVGGHRLAVDVHPLVASLDLDDADDGLGLV